LMTAIEATVSSSDLSYLFLLFWAFPLSNPAVDLMSFEVPVTWSSSRALSEDLWRARNQKQHQVLIWRRQLCHHIREQCQSGQAEIECYCKHQSYLMYSFMLFGNTSAPIQLSTWQDTCSCRC
jgi:hypothetical protein